jgi:hypothetical protein
MDNINEIRDNGDWIKAPFGGFKLGEPYESLIDQIKADAKEDEKNVDLFSAEGIRDFVSVMEKMLTHRGLFGSSEDKKYGTADSSIGGNDALNPMWQFNIDDDIIWPPDEVAPNRGLGRVYKETYQDTQHILWLSFGVPKFANLDEFYKNAGDSRLANIMTGSEKSLEYKLGYIVGTGVELAIKLPLLPLIGLYKGVKAIKSALMEVKVNKYFEMVPRMDLYYKTVTTILAHLSVNLGLTPNALDDNKIKKKPWYNFLNLSRNKDDEVDQFPDDDINLSDSELGFIQGKAPEILRKGPDILYILSKRERWEQGEGFTTKTMSERFKKILYGPWGSDIFKMFNDTMFKRYQYVGFRIERGTDMTETVSNSTGQPELAGKLNGKISEARERKFNTARGNNSGGIIGGLSKGANFVRDILEGVAKGLGNIAGLGDSISLVTEGSGYFDLPDVWQSSSFSKGFSFDIQLRARYGDPLTIYQSIYVPLAMLMAGAFPMGLGANTYTSPFLCQAYSKGLFSIPTGIIENMSIRRGLPEHGWSYEHLPVAVDVSITIKDMSPNMFLSLVDGNLRKLLNGNDSMKMYLGTLSGLEIADMTNKFKLLNRRAKALLKINKATIFNNRYWATKFSQSSNVRAGVQMLPRAWQTPNT